MILAPRRFDTRLTELHRGDWQGLSREEYAERWWAAREAYWSDPLGWSGHGGESHALRIDPARGMLLADEPGGWTLLASNLATPGEI